MRFILTFNNDNRGVGPLTALLHHQGHSVLHLALSGHQPLLTRPDYRARAAGKLRELVADQAVDVWIGMFEEVFFLAADAPSPRVGVLTNAPDVYARLHRKRSAAAFNLEHQLPHVPTIVPDARTTADALPAAWRNRPCLLKEDDSRGGYGTRIFADAETMWRATRPDERARAVIQPWWSGRHWVLQGIFNRGELVDAEVLVKQSLWDDRHTVRYLLYHRAVDSPGAEDLLRRAGRAARWNGMLEFECLGDEGDLRILEYNPRFSGDFLHTVYTGSSFGANTIRTYAGLPPVPRTGARAGVTRCEGLGRRAIRRQLSKRPAALLDARWVLEWARLERERRATKSPASAARHRPEARWALLS